PEADPLASLDYRRRLASARAQRLAGLPDEALRQVRSVVDDLDGAQNPAVLAEALHETGLIQRALGEHAAGVESFERAWRLALANHRDRVAILALLEIAHVRSHEEALFDEGMGRLEEARALFERAPEAQAAQVEADLWAGFGSHYFSQGLYDDARRYLERSRSALARRGRTDSVFSAVVAIRLGNALFRLGRYDEAREALETALELRRRHFGTHHASISSVLNSLGALALSQGRIDEGERLMTESVELTRALKPGHPDLMAPLNNIGLVRFGRGDYAAARERFTQAVTIGTERFGPEHPRIARALSNLGKVLTTVGAFDEADEVLRRALAISGETFGPESPHTLAAWTALALLEAERGEHDDAVAIHRRTLEIRERIFDAGHHEPVVNRAYLGAALLGAGRLGEAETQLRRSLGAMRDHVDAGNAKLIPILLYLGEVLLAKGDRDGARDYLEEAVRSPALPQLSPLSRSEVRFALARALPPGDARARPLAETAAADIAGEPGLRRFLTPIEDWLG
ncbi:MAG: tetratricopeptide repeat protein, partial [Acidobacteriota bacterium]